MPQIIDTTQEIVWVKQNVDGNDMFAPSYDNHVSSSYLNSDFKIKTNRPINDDDFFFMSIGVSGQVSEVRTIPITDLNGKLIMEELDVYKFSSDYLAQLKNDLTSQYPSAVFCFAFVDNGYVNNSVQTKPSITTIIGSLKYETELKETKVEFVLTEVDGKSMYLPNDNYVFDVLSINTNTRIKISRALKETDGLLMIVSVDGQTYPFSVPLSAITINAYFVSYSETEYGFNQNLIDEMASNYSKIGLYFVDSEYLNNEGQTMPTIDNYVMEEVVVGGLTNLCVPSAEISSDGVVEVRMKATNDLKNLSFVNKQYLKSFDGSRYGLDNIKEISNNQFESCGKLEEFIIPNGVETVGDFAFNNCFSLSSVTIPESVTEIGAKAFRKCVFLSENFINQSSLDAEANNYWRAGVYDVIQEDGLCIRGTSVWGCRPNSSGVTIPDYITRIEENAFIGCTNLKRVDMPNSIKYIGKNAFRYCINVEKVVIPESVEEIASDAFTYCFFDLDVFENKSNINAKENNYWQAMICKYGCVSCCDVLLYIDGENVIIHDGVKVINAEAVKNRESIKSIVIPNSVTSIGDYAFEDCSSLTSITIPSSVTSIGNYALRDCTSLKSVNLGSGVTSIGDSAFSSCGGLKSIVIPYSVTSIGNNAFYGCSGLTSVTIPDGIKRISNYAFDYCSSLTSITIPSSVTRIGHHAFCECRKLTSITCLATTAPILVDYSVFLFVPYSGVLHVPHGSDYTSWKSRLPSGWVIKYLYEPKECTNLVITANDVHGIQTYTQISYTATTNGINLITNEVINDVIVTGVTTSQSFEQNTSYTDTIEREITFEYLGVTASTTITQGVWLDVHYSIDLQDQWRMSSAVKNPDSSLYDGVYESFSNYNVNSSSATCVITINEYSNFKFYIRSYGEGSYDYVNVYDLDGANTIKATTKGKSNSGTTLSSYTLVEFTNLDGREHTIKIVYLKDSSGNSGTDRGYLMIPYNQDE